jgi:hypothetical protein
MLLKKSSTETIGSKASWTLGSGVWVNGERREVVLVEEGGVGVGVDCCCSSWSLS